MRNTSSMLIFLWLLTCVVQAENLITPEQAVRAVQQFSANPNILVTETVLRDERQRWPSRGIYYDMEVKDDSWSGRYCVRATDGMVVWMSSNEPTSTQGPPALSLQEAQAIAEEFVRQHYPRFSQCRWHLMPERYSRSEESYDFSWYEVLNEYGVLAPYDLWIRVNGTTGRIDTYGLPLSYSTEGVPMVPQVSREQAQRIAAPYTPYDPALAPFDEVYLQISQGPPGAQKLVWILMQHPDPAQPRFHCGVGLDAVTGEAFLLGGPIGKLPPGLEPQGKGGRRARPLPQDPRKVAVRSADGQGVGGAILEAGTAWVRVESLRALKVQVQTEPVLQVVLGERRLAGDVIGARQREYGWWKPPRRPTGVRNWWAPLRQVAEALGWQVTWIPARREAVIRADTNKVGGSSAKPGVP